MNKRVLSTLISLICIAGGTIVAIKFAQGYRPTTQGTLSPTGLLAANSFPNGASVYINGKLETATDTTLSLDPGTYDIEIRKDGYTSWRKTLQLEKELVTQTNAMLFPIAPSLTPLTFTGAQNVTPSPDGEQLAFVTASASATKNNGIYVLSLADNPISLQRGASQIAKITNASGLINSLMVWSPDLSQILLLANKRTYLLPLNRTTDLDTAVDIGSRREQILTEWRDTFQKKRQAGLDLFPPQVVAIASSSAKNIYISPDQERIIYTATQSAVIPEGLNSGLPAASTQKQERTLLSGSTYIYDRHEDRNFLIQSAEPEIIVTPSPTPFTKQKVSKIVIPVKEPVLTNDQIFENELKEMRYATSALFVKAPQWLSDSKHVVIATASGIDIVEYDGTNRLRVYAGPFERDFLYLWPNGSKLVILANFNEPGSGILNLYAVGIK